MLYQQTHFKIERITPRQIIIVPEKRFDEKTKRFTGEDLVSLTNKNSAIVRGAEIGHLAVKEHIKSLTEENLKHIGISGTAFVGRNLGFGSAIKTDGSIEISLNKEADDLWDETMSLSDNVYDMGKMELVNAQTRGFVQYKDLEVRTLPEGTKVLVNGTVLGICDGHGVAVGLTKDLRSIRATRFSPVTMPVNILSRLKGGTDAHVQELTTGIKAKSQRIRSQRLQAQKGSYESFNEAYVLLQKGRIHEERHMLFAASHSLERFSQTLDEGVTEGLLLKGKTEILKSLMPFRDRLVTSVAGEEFRTALTGGATGTSRVLIPCYDVAMHEIGLSNKQSGLKFIGVRQPVITSRNIFAYISKQIQMPRYASQYRAQFRLNGKLVSISKGIFSETDSVEIIHPDGTVELITESCLLIGEKDVGMGIKPDGCLDVELNITNRWRDLMGIHPDWLNEDASIDFDGDTAQIYQVIARHQELSKTWELVRENYSSCIHTHKKAPKIKVPWGKDWMGDHLHHLYFAVNSGEMMGTYYNALELLSMFEGKVADDIAHRLYKEVDSAEELLDICRFGYQAALDSRKRLSPDPEQLLDISRKIQGQFYKIENRGPIKADPLKFEQGWFSSFEPKKSLLKQRFQGVREDYLPAKIIQFAMQRNRQGGLKNWSKFSKNEPVADYRFQDFLPERLWTPNKMVSSWTLMTMREIVSQAKKVRDTGRKATDDRGREVVKYEFLDFVQAKRDQQLKSLVIDVAILRGEADLVYLTPNGEVHTNHRVNKSDWIWKRVYGLKNAAQEVMLTAFYLDQNRRSPRDNRDFALTYFQPEIAQYLRK